MTDWQIVNEKISFSNGLVSFNMIRIPGEGYLIGETPVTQGLWESVMGYNPSRSTNNPQNPVDTVSFNAVMTFIEKLNALTSYKFRLPTAHEWEIAAKGVTESKGFKFPGSDNLDEVSWNCYNSDGHTHPVKTKLPNEIGLYDMLGNVLEWCDTIPKVKSPRWPFWELRKTAKTEMLTFWEQAERKKYRMLKGGSFMNGSSTTKIEVCKAVSPDDFNIHIGFRLAMSAPISSEL